MDWKKEYANKIVSVEEAVSHVQSGNRIVFTHACGEAQALTEELVRQADRLENVEIVHMVAMGKAPYCQPGMEKHFRHNALFVGGSTRKAVEEGRGDYTPCFFHEIPKLFTDGTLPVDVAFLQLSEPDENGVCSYGVSVDYTQPAAEAAKLVIAQINKNMPYTYGNGINLKDIDYIVEKDEPLIELQPPKIGETEHKIGEYVASLIHDGDTLQLGIGAIPDAVLSFLGDKKDLGIHSEMFSFAFTAGNVRFLCLNTNALEFDYSSAVPNIQFIRDEGDHVPEGVEKTVVAMHAGPFSEQFNNNIAEYFHYYLKEMPDLQFCVYGHGHNVSVDEFFDDGIKYYECSCAKDRSYLFFTLNSNGYTYEVVNF